MKNTALEIIAFAIANGLITKEEAENLTWEDADELLIMVEYFKSKQDEYSLPHRG